MRVVVLGITNTEFSNTESPGTYFFLLLFSDGGRAFFDFVFV